MDGQNNHYSKVYDDVGRLIKKVYNNQEQIYQYYEENNVLNTKPSVETLMDGTYFIYTYDEREIKKLLLPRDNYDRLIVTYDYADVGKVDGIKIVHLTDFLLDAVV